LISNKGRREFAAGHSDKDRAFLLAAGGAGIEAATNIVVEQANRTMLFYVYAAVIVLASSRSAAGARWSWPWCR
jgi:hypothetical protein